MARLKLEWQVNLKHSGYYLNGRGNTPAQAIEDLNSRVRAQIDSASDETNKLGRKLKNLTAYQEQLTRPEFDELAEHVGELEGESFTGEE